MEIIQGAFHPTVKELEEDLLNMTHTAAKMLQMSIESLKERNIEKAEEAIALDDVVDDFNFKIEESAYHSLLCNNQWLKIYE